MTFENVGPQRECPNCGAKQYGKKKHTTFYNDVTRAVYCSNCGLNKPGRILL